MLLLFFVMMMSVCDLLSCQEDMWRYMSPKIAQVCFGDEFSHMDVEELKKKHVFQKIIKTSEDKIALSMGVCEAEEGLRIIARKYWHDFLEGKMTGWCKTFDYLYQWSGTVLPEDMVEETAFFRILLYIMLSNVGWKESIFDQEEEPPTCNMDMMDWLNFFLRDGKQYAFLFARSPLFCLVDFFVGAAQDKALMILPTHFEESRYTCVHGKLHHGFWAVFGHDMLHVKTNHKGAVLLKAVCPHLYQKMAQGVLKDIDNHWETDGVIRLILDYQAMHEEGLSSEIISSSKPLYESLPTLLAQNQKLITDMLDLLPWVSKEAIKKEQDAMWIGVGKTTREIRKMMAGYMQDVLQKIPMNKDEEQQKIRDMLAKEWSVDVSADFDSYDRLAIEVIKEILSQDTSEKIKEYCDIIMDILSIPIPNIKVFFVIADVNVGLGFKSCKEGVVLGVPLKSRLCRMKWHEKVRFLEGLLENKMMCVDYMFVDPWTRVSMTGIYMSSSFPWEKDFEKKFFAKARTWLITTRFS